jgi:hypothetical protein
MRLIPELLHDEDQLTAEPAVPDASPFSDIPRPIWTAFLSAWAVLFGLFLIFFTTDGPATLAVVTASFFGLMLLGLPAALGAQAKSPRGVRSRFIVTRNGPLPNGAAATQILLIPVGAVIGLSAFIALAL